jgi:uncharacterized protein
MLLLQNQPIIAMIHLPSLKIGSETELSEILDYIKREIETIENAGFDGIMLENFSDVPFVKTVVDEIVFAKLSIICHQARKLTKLPLGLNILRNASVQAIKLATINKFDFIRSNIWEGAYITDQGIIDGVAEKVISWKTRLNSNVMVFADIHVKHASPLGNFSFTEAAENALIRGSADAIIVSGKSTGSQPNLSQLEELASINIKPILGSGLNLDNISDFKKYLSGAIVGSSIKIGGIVTNQINPQKAKDVVNKWKKSN